MKLIFVSYGQPQDRRQWSGTVSYMYEELNKDHDIVIADIKSAESSLVAFISKCIHKFVRIFGKKYSGSYSFLQAHLASKCLQKYIDNNKDADAIFCISRSGAISFINTEIPVIYLCDATFTLLKDYYPHLTNVCGLTCVEGNYLEKKAFANSTAVICASQWVQESVVNDYGFDFSRTEIIPFGANCSEIEYDGKTHLSHKILFCGVEWGRKGGQIALDTVRELTQRGLNVELNIVGCNPPFEVNDKNVNLVGFLNKNIELESAKLEELYKTSDLLLLPTLAECAGIVFAEAASRGLPSVSFKTGGVENYVLDGKSGYTVPLGSDYNVFADIIENLYSNPDEFVKLGASARYCYDNILNWNHWRVEANHLLERVIK